MIFLVNFFYVLNELFKWTKNSALYTHVLPTAYLFQNHNNLSTSAPIFIIVQSLQQAHLR